MAVVIMADVQRRDVQVV